MNSEKIVYKIIDRDTGNFESVYFMTGHNVSEFKSVEDARTANCNGMFSDREQHKVSKYKVTYELIEDDCLDEPKEPLC